MSTWSKTLRFSCIFLHCTAIVHLRVRCSFFFRRAVVEVCKVKTFLNCFSHSFRFKFWIICQNLNTSFNREVTTEDIHISSSCPEGTVPPAWVTTWCPLQPLDCLTAKVEWFKLNYGVISEVGIMSRWRGTVVYGVWRKWRFSRTSFHGE